MSCGEMLMRLRHQVRKPVCADGFEYRDHSCKPAVEGAAGAAGESPEANNNRVTFHVSPGESDGDEL